MVAGTEPRERVHFARFGDTWLGEDNSFKVQTISIEKANAPEIVDDVEKEVFLIHYVLREGTNKRVMRTFDSIRQAEEYIDDFLERIGAVAI